MNDAEMIETALEIALAAHRGQADKAGAAYILHPLRVMARVSGAEAQAVALLHDVVEDSAATLDDLRARGFPEAVLSGVAAMTRREGEVYAEFIDRAAAHPLARIVKRADVEDNLDLRRLPALTEADASRLKRYVAAWRKLG